ncbi:hypothetical protein NKG05_30875 [Oerskovia sp. M15]
MRMHIASTCVGIPCSMTSRCYSRAKSGSPQPKEARSTSPGVRRGARPAEPSPGTAMPTRSRIMDPLQPPATTSCGVKF